MLIRSTLNYILLFALFGVAGSFYGNLYEAVVRVPEWQSLPPSMSHWSSPFDAGSPARYYVPIDPLSTIALWISLGISWKITHKTGSECRKSITWLLLASICGFIAQVLTIYIVLQLNTPLFFQPGPLPNADRIRLLNQWEILNFFRLVLRGATLFGLLRFLFTLRHG